MSDDGEPLGVRHLPGDLRLSIPSNGGGARTLKETVKSVERQLIARALVDCEGNKSAVARRLRVSYPTLLTKIREYSLDRV